MDKRKKDTAKDSALHRVKIIQGHLKKIEQMLEDDAYCVDVVHQSRAVQSAMKKMDSLIIENHICTCVINQINNGEAEKAKEELLRLFDYK